MGFLTNVGAAVTAQVAHTLLHNRRTPPSLITPLPAAVLAAEAARGGVGDSYKTFSFFDTAWSADFWIISEGEIIFPLLALATLFVLMLFAGARGLIEGGFPLIFIGALSVSLHGWLCALLVGAVCAFAVKRLALDNWADDAMEAGVAGLVVWVGAVAAWWITSAMLALGFWQTVAIAVAGGAVVGMYERRLSRYLFAVTSPLTDESAQHDDDKSR